MLSGKCGSLRDRALWGYFQASLGEGWRDRWWIDTVRPSAFIRAKPVACCVLSCALDLVCSACIFVSCVFMYVFVRACVCSCVYTCVCASLLCVHMWVYVYMYLCPCAFCVCVHACSCACIYSPWSCTNISSPMEFPNSSRKNQSLVTIPFLQDSSHCQDYLSLCFFT